MVLEHLNILHINGSGGLFDALVFMIAVRTSFPNLTLFDMSDPSESFRAHLIRGFSLHHLADLRAEDIPFMQLFREFLDLWTMGLPLLGVRVVAKGFPSAWTKLVTDTRAVAIKRLTAAQDCG